MAAVKKVVVVFWLRGVKRCSLFFPVNGNHFFFWGAETLFTADRILIMLNINLSSFISLFIADQHVDEEMPFDVLNILKQST